jgi:hypothetical protein
VAGFVLVSISSYVPLTVCITERRGKVGSELWLIADASFATAAGH